MDTTGCNPVTGTPINFYNRHYYPGGSSSGAGSALGAGVVPLCLGTDAGGSVRVPTSTAGCVALKPSHNRTMIFNSSMCVVGPMCANAADLTAAYRVMAQPDPDCPVRSLFAPSTPPRPADKKLLGVCRPWTDRASPAVRRRFDAALDFYVRELGYEVVDVDIPLLYEARIAHGAINLAEAADHARARVTPQEMASKGYGWTDPLSPANAISTCLGAQTPAADYLKFAQLRSVLMRHLAHLFETYGPSLLLASPTLPDEGYAKSPGDETYGFTDGNRTIRSMMFVWLANMSGCPAATLPVGYADAAQGRGRLPVGMMAMGMWGEEERCLAWARDGERLLRDASGSAGGRIRPEGWVDTIALAKEEKK